MGHYGIRSFRFHQNALMKRLYPSILLLDFRLWKKKFGFSAALVVMVFGLRAQTNCEELTFINPQLQKGPGFPSEGLDGATYIFRNVTTNVDAQVTIVGRSSSEVSLSSMDIAGPDEDPLNGKGYDKSWQPAIILNKSHGAFNADWWMEFKICFVEHNDFANPASVEQFYVTALHIDPSDSDQVSRISFYGLQSYTLEQNTLVSASSIKGCLADPHSAGTAFAEQVVDHRSSQNQAEVMVTNCYLNSSSFVLRIGGSGNHSTSSVLTQMSSLWFKSFKYTILHTNEDPMESIESTAMLDRRTPLR
jgi:hypothetical protein